MKGIIRKTILGIWFFGGLSACTSKPHFTITAFTLLQSAVTRYINLNLTAYSAVSLLISCGFKNCL